ncbi:MAG: DUF2007 domain-containing protein [bacterium]|nr:DUF2007 domain-containing protein [bacterium]
MDEQNLKKLIAVEGMMEAEIVKSKLESFEIPCMLKFESAGRLLGITMDGLGEVKVMVPTDQYEKAMEILESDDPTEETESKG